MQRRNGCRLRRDGCGVDTRDVQDLVKALPGSQIGWVSQNSKGNRVLKEEEGSFWCGVTDDGTVVLISSSQCCGSSLTPMLTGSKLLLWWWW